MQVVTRLPLSLPTLRRKHYMGTNKGNCFGPVQLDDWSECWLATTATKHEVYGRNHRIAVGGATEEDEEGGDEDDAAEDDPGYHGCAPRLIHCHDEKEPVFYMGMPVKFWEDVLQCYQLRNVIHLSAGDGALAKACLQMRRGYFGICTTQVHVDHLYEHLVEWMIEQMADSNSHFYQATLAQEGTGNADDAAGPGGNEKRKQTKARKTKQKKKRHQSTSPSSKGTDESESSRDSGDSG